MSQSGASIFVKLELKWKKILKGTSVKLDPHSVKNLSHLLWGEKIFSLKYLITGLDMAYGLN